tara:strand:- start:2829 stop:3023 length:195 start_codon:yes stop_codon:yes gene_type:complete
MSSTTEDYSSLLLGLSFTQKQTIRKYIQQLTPQEIKVLDIAKEHLGSSFNIEKSIGFIKWSENQ